MTDVIVIRWGGDCSRQARGLNHPNLSKHKKGCNQLTEFLYNAGQSSRLIGEGSGEQAAWRGGQE